MWTDCECREPHGDRNAREWVCYLECRRGQTNETVLALCRAGQENSTGDHRIATRHEGVSYWATDFRRFLVSRSVSRAIEGCMGEPEPPRGQLSRNASRASAISRWYLNIGI